MKQEKLTDIITDQTERALWEVKNVIDCVPDEYWDKEYCGMPVWKHIYHMLHSLDLWFINPRDRDFKEPSIHVENLNNLDVVSDRHLERAEIDAYYFQIRGKTEEYVRSLKDGRLLEKPEGCEYTKFTLILAQFRHLHTHMGMIMGFIVAETGLWPRVAGLEGAILQGDYDKYF